MKLYGAMHDQAKEAIFKIKEIPGEIIWQLLELIYSMDFPLTITNIIVEIGFDGNVKEARIGGSGAGEYESSIFLYDDSGRIVIEGSKPWNLKSDIKYHIMSSVNEIYFTPKVLAKHGDTKLTDQKLERLKQELLAFKLSKIIET